MLYTNLVFQSFPTLHSARIASQIHSVLLDAFVFRANVSVVVRHILSGVFEVLTTKAV